MIWSAESAQSTWSLNEKKMIVYNNIDVWKEGIHMSNKRLYKSSANCMLCGVCGGIAEYFDIDPTLVRLAWVVLTCFGGAGIWAYIVAAIIIPRG